MPPYYYRPVKDLRGVGGWLLTLCIYFTILIPVLSVIRFVAELPDIEQACKQFPSLNNLIIVDAILSIILIGSFVFAGYRLWAVRPHAVTIAKAVLIFDVVYEVASYIMLFTMSGMPKYLLVELLPEWILESIIGMGITIGIFVYLCVSKRVALMYGRTRDDDRNAPRC